MFDVDKDGVLSEYWDGGRIPPGSQLEIFVDLIEFSKFDFMLNSFDVFLGLGELLHPSKGFLNEKSSLSTGVIALACIAPFHIIIRMI